MTDLEQVQALLTDIQNLASRARLMKLNFADNAEREEMAERAEDLLDEAAGECCDLVRNIKIQEVQS